MTTANLSVGINTTKAKEAMTELRAWMAKDTMKLSVAVDPNAVERTLKGYLQTKKFKVGIDTKHISRELTNDIGTALAKTLALNSRTVGWNQKVFIGTLNSAFTSAFGQSGRQVSFDEGTLRSRLGLAVHETLAVHHHVGIDSAALTAQVKAAVNLGMMGHHVGVGASPQAGAGAAPILPVAALTGALTQVVQSVLRPSLDEMSKAATLSAGIARKKEVEAGGPKARRGKSATMEDGSSLSVSEPVKASEAVPAIDAALSEKDAIGRARRDYAYRRSVADKRITEAQRAASEAQKDSDRTFRARKSAAKYEEDQTTRALNEAQKDSDRTFRARRSARRYDEVQATREANEAQKDSDRTFRARKSAAKYEDTQATRALNEAQKDSNRTFAARRSARRYDEAQTTREAKESQKDSDLTFRARKSAAKYEETQATRALREAQADSNRTFAARKAARKYDEDRAAERAREAEKTLRQEMQKTYNEAKFGAEGYTAKGRQIVGAKALVEKYDADRAGQFLSNDALIRSIPHLENHRVKAAAAATGNKALASSMRDVHDGARGLAGSLGLLWLTWGSLAPLATGAAIGFMLKSTIVTGKELEFQLKFVSVLTDSTAISIERLGVAVQGTMAAPVEAAKGLRGLAQNGLSAKEALMALPDILALSTAGELDLTAAALGATGVMAAFNLQVSDLGRISDVFAKAASVSNTDVASMVEAMKQASTVSDQYHVSLEQTAASLAVLAKRNITGSAAGTAFRNMMSELAAPSEKAKQAMKQLGLELFDTNNQLKSYPVVLAQLREATLGLNEQGRLNFLGQLFDERGAKSANALLSDYKLLGTTLDTLTNSSEGFTRSVVESLGETTTGRVKKLVAEYQLLSGVKFEDSSNQIKNLVDSLRNLIKTDEFSNFMSGVTRFSVNLAQTVVNSGSSLAWLAGGFAALKLAVAGLGAVGVVTSGVMATILSPVSLLVGAVGLLAYGYVKLTSSTNDAIEAIRAKTGALKDVTEANKSEIVTLNDKRQLLAEEIRLLYEGKTAVEAKAQAETNVSKKVGGLKRSEITAQLRTVGGAIDRARAEQAEKAKNGVLDFDTSLSENLARRDALSEQLKALEEGEKTSFKASVLRRLAGYESARETLLNGIASYNETAVELNSRANFKKDPLTLLQTDNLERVANGGLESMLARAKAELNRRTSGFELLKTKPGEGIPEANALSAVILSQLDEEQARVREAIQLRTRLNQARYPNDLFGRGAANGFSEQQNLEQENNSILRQVQMVSQLKFHLAENGKLKDADRIKLTERIAKEEREIERSRENLRINQEISRLNVDSAVRKDRSAFDSDLTGLASQDRGQLAKLSQGYSTKVQRPENAAAAAARLEVEQRYAGKIADQARERATLEEALSRLRDEANESEGENLLTANQAVDALKEKLALESSRLAIMQAQASSAAQIAGKTASDLQLASEEAGYGWEKFWNEYRANAESNATIVYDTMKRTTSGMTDMFANFVTTGKLDFKGLVRTVIAEAARMYAARGVAQLLTMAGSYFFGGGGNTVSSGDAAAGLYQGSGATNFRNGGVMTGNGPLPLRQYRAGGIAHGRQLAEYGEGAVPEAYVPLQDGRSIPVTVAGGAAGGNNTVSVAVYISADGSTKVESDASGEKARQLGEMVGNLVTEKLLTERRPGGLLYA